MRVTPQILTNIIKVANKGETMKYEEAIGWLKGERSMCNSFGHDDESHAKLAEADAGCTQQAYWIVKAYKEGLIQNKIAVKPMSDAEESAWREE